MIIDLVFAIMALFGFYMGYSRGIIQTVFTFGSLFIGLLIAFKFAQHMTDFLSDIFSSTNPLMFIAGFLLSFVLTIIVIRMIARGLESILKSANINIVNRMIGGMFLSGVFILVLSVLTWFGDEAHLIDDRTKQQSMTYPYMQQYPTQVKEVAYKIQPTLVDFWNQGLDMLDRLETTNIEKTESKDKVYDIEEDK